MNKLTFNTISTWKCGKVTIADLLKWCDKHCEGVVMHTERYGQDMQDNGRFNSEAFTFTKESDITLFTLRWQ